VNKGKGWERLLQVSANDLNDVLGGFFRGAGVLGHVVQDVIFHEFRHEAVDGAASGGEAAKHLGTLLVAIEALENRLELADYFLSAVNEIQFFSRSV
jgi:hypothetical protein